MNDVVEAAKNFDQDAVGNLMAVWLAKSSGVAYPYTAVFVNGEYPTINDHYINAEVQLMPHMIGRINLMKLTWYSRQFYKIRRKVQVERDANR